MNLFKQWCHKIRICKRKSIRLIETSAARFQEAQRKINDSKRFFSDDINKVIQEKEDYENQQEAELKNLKEKVQQLQSRHAEADALVGTFTESINNLKTEIEKINTTMVCIHTLSEINH